MKTHLSCLHNSTKCSDLFPRINKKWFIIMRTPQIPYCDVQKMIDVESFC